MKSVRTLLPLALWVGLLNPGYPQTYWLHNGSLVLLEASGSNRVFSYVVPRDGLPVQKGSVLFKGKKQNDTYSGDAYVFSSKCGAIAYPVSGPVSSDHRTVTMYGRAPLTDATCKVTNYRQDTLIFVLTKNAITEFKTPRQGDGYTLNNVDSDAMSVEVLHIATVSKYLADLVASRPKMICSYFGYKVDCAQLALTQEIRNILERKSLEELTKIGMKSPNSAKYIRGYLAEIANDALKNTVWEGMVGCFAKGGLRATFPNTIHLLEPRPPYIPDLAYDNEPNAEYVGNETFNMERCFWGLGLEDTKSLKQIRLTASDYAKFSKTTSITGGPGGFGSWFPAIVPKTSVIEGDRAEDFWLGYERFSQTVDAKDCSPDCMLVVRQQLAGRSDTALSLCRVTAVAGIIGAPEQCVVVLYYRSGVAYLRAAQNWVGPRGGDAGADDISCRPPKGNIPLLIQQIAEIFEGLRDQMAHREYVVSSSATSDGGTVTVANRYTRSAFFSGMYEVSTIRIYLGPSDLVEGGFSLSIATTFLISEREARSPEYYRGVNPGEQSAANRSIFNMLPKALNCRQVRL